ncbi:MAG: hypothetical protein ABIV06_00400 [Thermoanaerobaculia bacterium]
MSCPDWRALVAARDASPIEDPAGWTEAVEHTAQCGRCRASALAADPLLLFARLSERQVAADEIADMQAAVAALVRAGRVGKGGDRALSRRAGGAFRLSLPRVAAALGVCSLLALSGAPRPQRSTLALLPASGVVIAGETVMAEETLSLGSVVEELDRPGARIYELPQSDMAVVMIVDASLDV